MTIIFMLIGAVIGAAIGALIGALFLMLATKMVVKAGLGYGKAYKLTLMVYLVSMLISVCIVAVTGVAPAAAGTFSMPNIVGWVAGLLFGGYWYGSKIEGADGSPIGFGNGVLVALVIIVISILIGLLLATLFGGAAYLGAQGATG